jgi:two-component system KDP operon response regulator KdpE
MSMSGSPPATNGNRHHVLIVDDDRRMRRLLDVILEHAGYRVSLAADGTEALARVPRDTPDLVVLDVRMPVMDGLTCLQHLRAVSAVLVIILTASNDESEKARSLDLGAVDFFLKPFTPVEVLARVQAAVHGRLAPHRPLPAAFTIGAVTIDLPRQAVRRGRDIRLTPIECTILGELVRHRGHVVPHADLLTHVWGVESSERLDYLWMFVQHLRRIIEPNPLQPRYLLGGPGSGFTFAAD